jgi:ribonuclease VapC
VVIDSSALLAIFFGEPERDLFLKTIADANAKSLSVATVLETAMVLESRKGSLGGNQLDSFIMDANIRIIPVDVVCNLASRERLIACTVKADILPH